MEEIFIGIDYSRISPAMTVIKKDGIYFYSFPREGNIKESYKEVLETSEITVNLIPKIDGHTNLENMESSYSYDAELLAETVCAALKEFISNDYKLTIALEGLSFASTGSSSLTYAGYHFIFRYLLSKTLNIKYEDIHIIAPGTLKKTAGKGNLKKDEMIAAFISDSYWANTKFHQILVNIPTLFQSPKAKHFMKPLDDIVDSAYAAKYLWNKAHGLIQEPKIKIKKNKK